MTGRIYFCLTLTNVCSHSRNEAIIDRNVDLSDLISRAVYDFAGPNYDVVH